MAKILLDDEISKLNIEKEIEEKLTTNGFKFIRDIWVLKRANLILLFIIVVTGKWKI